MSERFALYYAPPTDSPLWQRAAQWLGRDPADPSLIPPDVPGIETGHRLRISESARRYGFHATIKAPMAIAPGKSQRDLETALAAFAATTGWAPIGRLKLAFIDGFLALIPERQGAEMEALAARVVRQFEPYRAPLADADREKRILQGRLSARQIELLDAYGYPYVMDQFGFHMTLTDRLPPDGRKAVLAAAEGWFADAITSPLQFDRIVLYREPSPGVAFARVADFPLAQTVAADA